MEYLLNNTLGLEDLAFVFSARRASMKTCSSSSSCLLLRRGNVAKNVVASTKTRNLKSLSSRKSSSSFLLEDVPAPPSIPPITSKNKQQQHCKIVCIEDEDDVVTLETLNSSSCEEEMDATSVSTNATTSLGVTFASPMITAVYTYPRAVMTLQDKQELFYTDIDYRMFRMEFFEQRKIQLVQNKRPRKVKFLSSTNVVSHIHTYHRVEETMDPNILYYSEHDLQRFLDEFVNSLNGMMGMTTSTTTQPVVQVQA